jgi:hypothetical protein
MNAWGKFKKWAVGTGAAIAAAVGIQTIRPKTIETPPQVHVQPAPTPIQKPAVTGLHYPSLVVGKITGATDEETSIIMQAIGKANAVLKSDCFHQHVLTANFTSTNGLTNKEIFDVLSAKPRLANVELFDGTWKQNQVWRTIAYDQGDGVVYVNRYFFGDVNDCASMLMHEAIGHQNGFTHESAEEYTSIPYEMNSFFDACNGKI